MLKQRNESNDNIDIFLQKALVVFILLVSILTIIGTLIIIFY